MHTQSTVNNTQFHHVSWNWLVHGKGGDNAWSRYVKEYKKAPKHRVLTNEEKRCFLDLQKGMMVRFHRENDPQAKRLLDTATRLIMTDPTFQGKVPTHYTLRWQAEQAMLDFAEIALDYLKNNFENEPTKETVDSLRQALDELMEEVFVYIDEPEFNKEVRARYKAIQDNYNGFLDLLLTADTLLTLRLEVIKKSRAF